MTAASPEPMNAGLPIEARIMAAYRDALQKHAAATGVGHLLNTRMANLKLQLGAYQNTIGRTWTAPANEVQIAREGRERALSDAEMFFTRWQAMSEDQAARQIAVEGISL